MSAQFVWRMEDVLELYEEPYDPNKPVVCFDEMPYQMVAEKRTPLPQKPGRPQRYDYEYERKGMLNIFAFFEPESGWRHLDITERRTAVDFALAMRRLVDEHYPTTKKVLVVLDNLNTHSPASLYKPRLVVQGVRAGGSQTPLAPAGVPPHPHARLLAEHG